MCKSVPDLACNENEKNGFFLKFEISLAGNGMKRLGLLIVTLLFGVCAAIAQHSSWYSGDLLTNNQLQCIAEDDFGFLWVGTEYGLNRFDGYQFMPFYHDDADELSLANNYVRCMAPAQDGALWVGTGRGIQLFRPDTKEFRSVEIPGGSRPFINQICVMDNGEVWFLASGVGICRISDVASMSAEILDEATHETGTRNHTSLIQDSHGMVWIGTGSGVYRCNPSTLEVTPFRSDTIMSGITGICEDDSDNIFFSTHSQVYCWNRSDDSLKVLAGGRTFREITHTFIDGDFNLYVAVRGEGLRIYNPSQDKFTRYDDNGRESGLHRLDVSAFYMDTQRNLWLGCYLSGLMLIPNGQTRFRSLRFQDYRGFSVGGLSSMLVDADGNLWTGYNNNPVTCFDSDGTILFQLQEQPYVSCLFQASDGTVWAGTYNGVLSHYDGHRKRFEPSVRTEGNSTVQSIVQDKKGNIYFSTRGTGLNMFNPVTSEYRRWSAAGEGNDKGGLDNDWINSLAVDVDDVLWIAHNSGVNRMNLRTGEFIEAPEKMKVAGSNCYFVLCDAKGLVWVGTGNGLLVYDGNTGEVRHVDYESGLSNNNICALVQDADGNVWCSTSMGLNRIDPSTWQIDRFYSGGGLIDRNYYKRACAVTADARTVYFGSASGITCFVPSEIDGSDNVRNVLLTGFYLNDTAVDENTQSGRHGIIDGPVITSGKFHLSDKDNSFTMEFSTFDYGDRDCISYEYSFNEGSWNSTPAGVNRITFTHLGAGKHQLSVRACNNNSRSEISRYIIKVDRPWFLGWAAILAYILTVCCVFSITIRNSRQKREKELSDAKLHSFTNIAHELCSPLTMVISPLDELMHNRNLDEDSHNSVRMMHRSCMRILNLLNQLLDIRKYDEGLMHLKCCETDMVHFIQEAFEMFVFSAGQRNIRYSFEHPCDEMLVWIDRDSIEKVMVNLISNAFKYTPDGGEITVELKAGTDDSQTGPLRHFAEVSVVDSGVGLDVNDVNRVFDRFYRAQNTMTSVTLGSGIGLNYSRILVEMHRGTIKAENRQGAQGSRFSFRLPLGSTHLHEDEISRESNLRTVLEDKGIAEPDAVLKSHAGAARGYKILVIDDDEAMLDYVVNSLRSSYYKVISCRNGKEGLHTAISQMPDLIISDVVMPEMDGMSFVRALKNNPNISHIPVILLSARNRFQDRMAGMETGADVYLPKPFYMNELKLQVSNLINNRLIMKGKYSGDSEQRDKVENIEVQSMDEHLMNRIMDVVNKNLSNPDFSVEQLADAVGVSRTQLHRKVKNITGLSAGRFIHNIRMQQAAKLLETKGLTVTEVADRVGFNTRANFATAFKACYGMSPTDYMKNRVSAEAENADLSDGDTVG